MKRYSKNNRINSLVLQMLKQEGWRIRKGKHAILIGPTGWRLTVPSTPSDRRAYKNFYCDVRRLNAL